MKKIYIKTTETCQLYCRHCYVGDNRKCNGFFDERKTVAWLKQYVLNFGIQEKDILFSFHGGEPFLCPLNKMQKVVDAFPAALFDATSNLCFPLKEERMAFIQRNFFDKYGTNRPFIKTSWDHKIRFQNEGERSLWEKNVRTLLQNNVDLRVVICLTSLLIAEVEPSALLAYMLQLGIKHIDFEKLTENTTEDKTLIPNYNKQDEWLLQFYEVAKDKIAVGMFENLKLACNQEFIGCRKRECMQEVITINANGTIGGCPNSSIGQYYTDINQAPTGLCQNCKRQELINKEQTRNMGCYICDLYDVCNGDCHQLSWQGGICPAPKKLIRRIKDELERAKKTGLSNM
jgi:radical SAM protein with 4Fe4S-binding SPASM domain